jgi:hypothetical protein
LNRFIPEQGRLGHRRDRCGSESGLSSSFIVGIGGGVGLLAKIVGGDGEEAGFNVFEKSVILVLYILLQQSVHAISLRIFSKRWCSVFVVRFAFLVIDDSIARGIRRRNVVGVDLEVGVFGRLELACSRHFTPQLCRRIYFRTLYVFIDVCSTSPSISKRHRLKFERSRQQTVTTATPFNAEELRDPCELELLSAMADEFNMTSRH